MKSTKVICWKVTKSLQLHEFLHLRYLIAALQHAHTYIVTSKPLPVSQEF